MSRRSSCACSSRRGEGSAEALPGQVTHDKVRRPRAPERCRSGRTGRSRKPKYLQGYRGFESHPLRHVTSGRQLFPPSARPAESHEPAPSDVQRERRDLLERCPSGLRSMPGKHVCRKRPRGFESRSLRQRMNEGIQTLPRRPRARSNRSLGVRCLTNRVLAFGAWAPCAVDQRTRSGPEGSSRKQDPTGAAGQPAPRFHFPAKSFVVRRERLDLGYIGRCTGRPTR